MPRELLLLRHAKSDWGSDALTDFARPLAKRGQNDAPKIGAWLYQEGLVADHVVSSPAERARQTAIKVCEPLAFEVERIVWDPAIYEAGTAELLGVLARCPQQTARVLLIGHNPGFDELLHYVVGETLEVPEDGKLMTTAAVARLEMPDDWKTLALGCARLLSLTRPRSL